MTRVVRLSRGRERRSLGTAVRVLPDAPRLPAAVRTEFLRGGVVEHQKGADAAGEREVPEDRVDVEAVAHPVGGGAREDTIDFAEQSTGHCGWERGTNCLFGRIAVGEKTG